MGSFSERQSLRSPTSSSDGKSYTYQYLTPKRVKLNVRIKHPRICERCKDGDAFCFQAVRTKPPARNSITAAS